MPISAGAITSGYYGGDLAGSRTNQGSEAYGYRPLVPDPLGSASRAIGGNSANLGQLYGLAGGLNQFNEQQLIDQLVQGLPGYQANIGQASANTASNLAGQLPPDVIRQMQIRAAERGIGAPGPNANAAYLAAIGRNSLDLQNLGDQQLTAQIARTPKAPLYDPSQMFVQPDQIQQAASAANLYASAPNPAAAAAERLRIAQQFGSQTPTVGGLMGVNRGGGPATPYDLRSPGVVGPYGAYPNAVQPGPAGSWSAADYASQPSNIYGPPNQQGIYPSLSGPPQGSTYMGQQPSYGPYEQYGPPNLNQYGPFEQYGPENQQQYGPYQPYGPYEQYGPTGEDLNLGSGYDQGYLGDVYGTEDY